MFGTLIQQTMIETEATTTTTVSEELTYSNSLLKNAMLTYDEHFLSQELANELFEELKKLDWKVRNYRGLKLNRYTVAYGDSDITERAPIIWGDDIVINAWTEPLLKLKQLVEERVGTTYNICLGNYYKTGKQYIAMHSDNEEYGSTKSIASISLGAERSFQFVGKSGEADQKLSIKLAHGSLLLMGENCQENYRHGMKKEKSTERINITFRKFIYNT